MFVVTIIGNAYSDGERPVSAAVKLYTNRDVAERAYQRILNKKWLCKVELHEVEVDDLEIEDRIPADASGF